MTDRDLADGDLNRPRTATIINLPFRINNNNNSQTSTLSVALFPSFLASAPSRIGLTLRVRNDGSGATVLRRLDAVTDTAVYPPHRTALPISISADASRDRNARLPMDMVVVIISVLGFCLFCLLVPAAGRLWSCSTTMPIISSFRDAREMTLPLVEALERTVELYSDAVLDDHRSLLLDIHGIHAFGPEWAADSCEACTLDDREVGHSKEEKENPLRNMTKVERLNHLGTRHAGTLLHRLAVEVISFCMEVDQATMERVWDRGAHIPSSWVQVQGEGWRLWNDEYLRQFRGDTDLCSRFFPLAVWLKQGDEIGRESLADRYRKRAKELAEPGNGYSSMVLARELWDMARRLTSAAPGPRGDDDDDLWYRLGRYGPQAESDADRLAGDILLYLQPGPRPAPPSDTTWGEANVKWQHAFPTWQRLEEKNHPFINEDMYLDRGLLLFHLYNTRQAIGSLCDEITTDVITPFRDDFLPLARDMLKGMRAMAILIRGQDKDGFAMLTGLYGAGYPEAVAAASFLARVDSLIDRAEAFLNNASAVLHLPWERDCARVLERLAAAEEQLAAVGRTLQAAKAAGWYLVDDDRITTSPGNSKGGDRGDGTRGARHFPTLVRVFLPSRWELARAAWSASVRLLEATWNGGHRSLGHWLGGTDVLHPGHQHM